MSDKTCKTCKWWYNKQFCDFVDTKEDDQKSKRFEIDIQCSDDQGLSVRLFTGPDFGCVHHKGKE